MLGQMLMDLLYPFPLYQVPEAPGRLVEFGITIPKGRPIKDKPCRQSKTTKSTKK